MFDKNLLVLITSLFLISCGNYSEVKNPSSGDSGDNNPTKQETKLNFATIKSEILDAQCISCHTGRHKAYENYEVVKASAFAMLERMQATNPTRLMPQGGPPLSPDLIARFKEWVDAGAPEFTKDPEKPGPTKPVKDIGFDMVLEKVLKPYNCTACHSQYKDYAAVYKDRGSIVSLVSSDAMPFPKRKGLKVKPVADEDKTILLNWIGKGSPEFANVPAEPPVQEELKPTWISLRNQVFGPKCILCHNTYGSRGGGRKQAFDSYSRLRNWFTRNPNLFKFDKEEGDEPGLFIDAMTRCEPNDPFCFESMMPYNTPNDDVQKEFEHLDKKEIEVIKKWVELKLPYDEDEI